MNRPELTVVFEDGVIIKNGSAKRGFVFPNTDPNWRVMQWYGTHGWIEVYIGDRVWLETDADVAPYSIIYDSMVE